MGENSPFSTTGGEKTGEKVKGFVENYELFPFSTKTLTKTQKIPFFGENEEKSVMNEPGFDRKTEPE